jgi:hypothetical protein
MLSGASWGSKFGIAKRNTGAELPKLVRPVELEGVWKGALYLVFQERLAVAVESTVVLYLALLAGTEPPRTCGPVEFKNANVEFRKGASCPVLDVKLLAKAGSGISVA